MLTGNGTDGVRGLVDIKAHEGLCPVQDPAEAVAPAMPVNALRHDHVDAVVPLVHVASVLNALATGRTIPVDGSLRVNPKA